MAAVGFLVVVVGAGACLVELAGVEGCFAEIGVEGCLAKLVGVEDCLAELAGAEVCLEELAAGVEDCLAKLAGVASCFAKAVGGDVCFTELEEFEDCLDEEAELEFAGVCLAGVEFCFAEEVATGVVDVVCLDALEGVDAGVCFVDEAGVEGCLLLVVLVRGVDDDVLFLVDDKLDSVEFCRVVVFEPVVEEEED